MAMTPKAAKSLPERGNDIGRRPSHHERSLLALFHLADVLEGTPRQPHLRDPHLFLELEIPTRPCFRH